MKLSVLLPWVCVAGVSAAAAALYMSNHQKDADLASARQGTQEVEQMRQALKEAEATSVTQSNQLVELRGQQGDLMRLRNENRQLREENQQLTKQVQSTQTQAAQERQAAQTVTARAQQQMQQLQTENERLRTSSQQQQQQQQLQQQAQVAQINACINNLRQIDGAKQQWALENRKLPTAVPTAQELAPYLRGGIPTCPGGGQYSINAVNVPPGCSLPGHTLPR